MLVDQGREAVRALLVGARVRWSVGSERAGTSCFLDTVYLSANCSAMDKRLEGIEKAEQDRLIDSTGAKTGVAGMPATWDEKPSRMDLDLQKAFSEISLYEPDLKSQAGTSGGRSDARGAGSPQLKARPSARMRGVQKHGATARAMSNSRFRSADGRSRIVDEFEASIDGR